MAATSGFDPSAAVLREHMAAHWRWGSVRPSGPRSNSGIAQTQPAGSSGRFARIGYLLADGEVEDPLKTPDPLARLDAMWETIKQPLKMGLSPDRFAHIPETIKRSVTAAT